MASKYQGDPRARHGAGRWRRPVAADLSGPISLSDTLPIARQIADAIEAAHSQGIVHRDLKPANIKLRPDGTVKVLDFGLAKALGSAAAAGAEPGEFADVDDAGGDGCGRDPGMPAYMAPEQARGKAVDKRADVWAFGCVLFEMLSGQRAFVADGVTDTLAAVITKDPNWAALPQATPPAIRRLLRRCLEKNPRDRIHDIADARLDIEDTLAGRDTDGAAPAATTTPARRATTAWFVAAVTGVALVAALTFAAAIYDPDQLATIPTARYMVAPPDGWRVSTVQSAAGATVPLSVSPDGRRIAFIARNAEGKDLLWIQPLEDLAAYPLAGTEGAIAPFWSADSRFVGFVAEQKLKKIEASGGVPFSICDVGPFRGGAWNGDDLIVFATSTGGLQKVSAAGGAPAAATVVQAGEIYHTRPLFLPSSRRFLFRVMPAGETYAGSLDSDERALVLKSSDSTNIALSRSHLLFLRETTLMAQPFDSRQLRVTSDAFPIAERIVTQNALVQATRLECLPRRTTACWPSRPERRRRDLPGSAGRDSQSTSRERTRGFRRPSYRLTRNARPWSCSTRPNETATSGLSIWRVDTVPVSRSIPWTTCRPSGPLTPAASYSRRAGAGTWISIRRHPTVAPAPSRSSSPATSTNSHGTGRTTDGFCFSARSRRQRAATSGYCLWPAT